MANDPGLAGDTCIFSEAISGDGGVHNPNDTWWLSPDINLVGPVSGPDNADPGRVNPVHVKLHRKAGTCTFPGDESLVVTTVNPDPQKAQQITLRAVLDLKPTDFVRTVVDQRTKRFFGQPATKPPPAFGFDVSPLSAVVTDHSHPSTIPLRPPNLERPSFDAIVKLTPLQLINVKFFADLTKTNPGDFFIFHLTQIGPDNHVQGGLTVVMGKL